MRDARRGFTMVFHDALDVLRREIEDDRAYFTARGVYFGLCEMHSREWRRREVDGSFRMAKSQVAALIGVSKRTLDEYVAILERVGLIRYEARENANGSSAPGEWILLDVASGAPEEGGAAVAPYRAADGGSSAPPTRARVESGKKTEDGSPLSPPEGGKRPRSNAAERAAVNLVFNVWKSCLPEESRSRSLLTRDRETKCLARLREGYSAETLVEAVRGVFRDPWHVERRKWEMEYVLRSGSHVDRFVDVWRNGPAEPAVRAGSGGAADALAARLAAKAGEVGALFGAPALPASTGADGPPGSFNGAGGSVAVIDVESVDAS